MSNSLVAQAKTPYQNEPPFTPEHTPTYPTFDTGNTPSQYIGLEAPASDPQVSSTCSIPHESAWKRVK